MVVGTLVGFSPPPLHIFILLLLTFRVEMIPVSNATLSLFIIGRL